MPDVTVPGLPAELPSLLQAHALEHGRSLEAEALEILTDVLAQARQETGTQAPWPNGAGLGAALAAIGGEMGGVELGITRDKSPPRFPGSE